MNILFLALDIDLSNQRGDSIHTRELARFLAARGHRVDLVTATEDGVDVRGVHHHHRPNGGDVRIVRFCSKIASDSAANVTYERRLSPKIAFGVSRLAGLPYVVEINGIEEEAAMQGREPKSAFRRVKSRIRRRMMLKASGVVAVSALLGEVVHGKYGVPRDRISVVSNGVDTDRFRPMDPSDARGQIGWAEAPWVVFVGNLVAWQGLETLMRAAPEVMESRGARFAIVGDGQMRPSLETLGRTLGVSDRISFAGSVPYETVPLYIGAASTCVAPFTRMRNEAIGLSPLKVYEYFACGRPVVASGVPGITELMQRSGAGVVVPPDDPGALASALVEVLGNPAEAREMGEQGRAFAVNECSWKRTAEGVERALESALRTA